MIRVARLIEEQRQGPAGIEDRQIQIAVVVDVAQSHTSSRLQRPMVQSGFVCDLFEPASSSIPEELERLNINLRDLRLLDKQEKNDLLWPRLENIPLRRMRDRRRGGTGGP